MLSNEVKRPTMLLAVTAIAVVLVAILIFVLVTGRFSPKEGIGCFVAVALVALAFGTVAYMVIAHSEWYRFW